MAEMILPLKRTVFLPKGSPGICSVREIKADVRNFEVAAEGGRVFCSGEVDLLIEYLSFAPGKQYPGYESYEQQMDGGGSMWQALLTVPFALDGAGDMPCPPLAEVATGEMTWFMVSPHALEMEIALCLSWQVDTSAQAAEKPAATQAEPAGWRQITLADVEQQNARLAERRHNLNTSQMKTKEECLTMEHDDKIMRMGVSDQGWRITALDEEQPQAEAATPEAAMPEPVAEAAVPEPVAEAAMPEPAMPQECQMQTTAPEPSQQETSILAAAIEEITAEEAAAEEAALKEVVEVIEEVIEVIEEIVAEEPLIISSSPLLNIQTVETPWQPPVEQQPQMPEPVAAMPEEYQPARSRAAGLPRLHVRHQQIRRSSYQVNFQMEDK